MRVPDKITEVLLFLTMSLSLPLWAKDSAASSLQNQKKAQSHFVLCASCHGTMGEGKKLLQAPAIASMPKWYVKKQLHNFKHRIRAYHPKDTPGHRMGPMARTLKDEDLDLIAQYVSELPKPKLEFSLMGDPHKGQKLYNVCVACHGQKGEGNEVLQAPPLANQNDWYLETQLKNYKNGLRGADPVKDPMGYSMVAMSKTLVDDQAIHDVIDYILAMQGVGGEQSKK